MEKDLENIKTNNDFLISMKCSMIASNTLWPEAAIQSSEDDELVNPNDEDFRN